MSTFVLERLEAVVGKQYFYTLKENEFNQVLSFMQEVLDKKQYEEELYGLFQCMERIANLQRLPATKFRAFKEGNTKTFELKSKHLRFYGIHQDNAGKVVLLGGYKNTQKRDLVKMRNIRERYLLHLEKHPQLGNLSILRHV